MTPPSSRATGRDGHQQAEMVGEEMGRFSSYMGAANSGPRRITDIVAIDRERTTTGIGEFDRVLGGGVVPGSLVLIGGDPRRGKIYAF